MDLDPMLRSDRSFHFPTDDDYASIDFAFNRGSFTNHKSVRCKNGALKTAADSGCSLKRQIPFKTAPMLNHCCNIVVSKGH
jgi:hypothetical protein